MGIKTIALSLIMICIAIMAVSPVHAAVLDNQKHVFVYLENTQVNNLTHDPLCNAMFHEYNITYVFSDTIASQLTTANCDLLVIPSTQMSTTSSNVVNNYIANGGSVFILYDPQYDETGKWVSTSRLNCLPNCNQVLMEPKQNLTLNNTEFPFLPASYSILENIQCNTFTRCFGSQKSGAYNGFNYNVLVTTGSGAGDICAKVWNPSTGSRIVYSDPQCFISGGSCSYFDSITGTRVFNNLKSWALHLDNNSMGVSVSYPKGDKQFVLTFDDGRGATYEINATENFYNMLHSFPYHVGSTLFLIQPDAPVAPGCVIEGYNYYNQQGSDTYTIHPHNSLIWSQDIYTQSDIDSNLSQCLNQQNIGLNTTNYPRLSFRFPGTTGTAKAFQGVSDMGYKVSANYGPQTGMGPIGSTNINNAWFEKQQISYGKKTNVIEFESPGKYDIDEYTSHPGNGDMYWTSDAEAQMPYFLNINFPGVYVLGGHCGYAQTKENYTQSIQNMLYYLNNQSQYTSYTDLGTIAQYEIGLQNSKVQATINGNVTTATVTVTQPIKDFTLKFTNIQLLKGATLDGNSLTSANMLSKDNVYYVFADMSQGTHTITVTDVFAAPIDNLTNITNVTTITTDRVITSTYTYEGSGQGMHPDVYFNNTSSFLNVYHHAFWMADTPYPHSNDGYETPAILCSDDGFTWVKPENVHDPISPEVPYNWGHDDDTDMIYNTTSGKLECYYIVTQRAGTINTVQQRIYDGSTVSGAINCTNYTGPQVSPAIIRNNDGTYDMWCVNISAVPFTLYHQNSRDGVNWTNKTKVNITAIPGMDIWHFNVQEYNNEYVYMLTYCTAGVSGSGAKLYIGTSTTAGGDITTQADKPLINIEKSGSFDDNEIYRSCSLMDSKGYIDIWFSGDNASYIWFTAYAQASQNNTGYWSLQNFSIPSTINPCLENDVRLNVAQQNNTNNDTGNDTNITQTINGYAYIANSGNSTVSVMNLTTRAIDKIINVQSHPWGTAISPDQKTLYVTNVYGNTVSVINTTTNTIIANMKGFKEPWGIAVSPDGSRIYVANSCWNNVSVVDAETKTVLYKITVGQNPRDLKFSPDGSKVYVTSQVNNSIAIIDTITNSVTNITGFKQPWGITLTSDGKKAYVDNYGNNIVSVVDLNTNSIITNITGDSNPVGIAISPDNSRVYVTSYAKNNVSVIDTATNSIITKIPVSTTPYGVSTSVDGKTLYVTDLNGNCVSVVDTTTNKVKNTISGFNGPCSFGEFIISN